jgi:[ribosomal protein S18]-alanine N-acetyltransferase
MSYSFELMTHEQAESIAYHWHYDGKYSFYNMEADQDDLLEFLDPIQRSESKYVVLKDREIIGFYSFTKVNENVIDVGLGMRPDLTGKGLGKEFLEVGIDFAVKRYAPEKITLSVATFNLRAIKVYKSIGFIEKETFLQETNGGSFEFLKMDYIVKNQHGRGYF